MLLLVLALIALPLMATGVFVIELAAGLARPARRGALPAPPGEVVVIMPAHDEAAILDGTLGRLAPAIEGWARLLLVADNCTDDTAAIARRFGAEVIERTDAQRRGKGFALDFAREHLRAAAPAAVIVFDADCWSDRDSLRALAARALAGGRPCQAVYLIAPTAAAAPMVQLSSFAFMIKNLVRLRGLQRLSARVHLTGTGMGFAWPLFDRAPLASASIVEDLELGLALDSAGFPPQLVPEALVWSDPSGAAGTLVQRTRWEGGFIAIARTQAPRAVAAALRGGNLRSLAVALDLCVPPLTLLALLDSAVLAVAALAAWAELIPWGPVQLHLAVMLASLAAVAVAWWREGRAFIGPGALARIPLYMLWKVPLYLGLVRGTPREWLRAGR